MYWLFVEKGEWHVSESEHPWAGRKLGYPGWVQAPVLLHHMQRMFPRLEFVVVPPGVAEREPPNDCPPG